MISISFYKTRKGKVICSNTKYVMGSEKTPYFAKIKIDFFDPIESTKHTVIAHTLSKL